jgi:hypothetical protein
MNIKKIDDLYKPNVSSSNKTGGKHGFKQIFDRTLNEINPTPAPGPIDDKINVIEQGDKILNLLDDYARQLTDPGKTLKDIGPLVDRIEKEVRLIETEAAAKVRDDQELETIIKDLSITANVAVLKFQRGDYI